MSTVADINKPPKPKQYFYINKVRCPYNNNNGSKQCNKKTSHLLFVMVGENLDIKSLHSAYCEDHAQKVKERLEQSWDIELQNIDELNEIIKQKYYYPNEGVNNNNESEK